ncbi:MAG: 6,7-dimethyl-8-ribityllumazine synthase [Micrococcales bacterium]|nr:6,7-dimethyl-8-ribityllumazine synthase [Micrococcales bacterium]
MSGTGAPGLDLVDARGLKVVVVAASWHENVMKGLVAGAQRALDDAGVTDVTLVQVPGTVELTVAASAAVRAGADAVVALGVVGRGGKPHFDYVCQSVTYGLTEVALRTGVPVGFGILTCDTEAQALDRAGLADSHEDKGAEAATAAVATAIALQALEPAPHR